MVTGKKISKNQQDIKLLIRLEQENKTIAEQKREQSNDIKLKVETKCKIDITQHFPGCPVFKNYL